MFTCLLNSTYFYSHAVGVRYCLRYQIIYGHRAAILFSYLQCKTSFDLASEKLSHVWVRLFLGEIKIVTKKDRTYDDSKPVWHVTTKLTFSSWLWFRKGFEDKFKDNNEKTCIDPEIRYIKNGFQSRIAAQRPCR